MTYVSALVIHNGIALGMKEGIKYVLRHLTIVPKVIIVGILIML
jgi:hypothetical protein